MDIQAEDSGLMSQGGDLPNFSLAGTGKTLTALEAFKKSGHSRGLVLGPVISLQMWKEESEEWLGCKTQVLRSGRDIVDPSADLIVAPYDLASGSQRSALYKTFTPTEGKTSALILDESDRLRRATSKRACAVYGNHTDGRGGFMENHDQVWHMTGNPVYRFHDDLWPMLRAMYPEVLEKYSSLEFEQFVRNFCVTKLKQFNKRMQPKLTIVRSQSEAVIYHILYKEIGAIRRHEAPDLPELVESTLQPKLGAVPAEYGKLVNKMTEQALLKALVTSNDDGEIDMQHVWQAVALAKVKGAAEYIEDCCKQSPVLIGVWHNSVGQAYYEELTKAGLKVRRVYGATPDREREEIRDLFNAAEIDVIVGQMQAMGVSWNLQKSSHRVIIAQDHFSPSVIEQFYKRVWRKGQESKTYLDFLSSEHPLDRIIAKVRKSRQRSQEKSLG
jgi:SWI/SNF-related matrix-associated actin-dependent regulator 1 of chromatin subfamily A